MIVEKKLYSSKSVKNIAKILAKRTYTRCGIQQDDFYAEYANGTEGGKDYE